MSVKFKAHWPVSLPVKTNIKPDVMKESTSQDPSDAIEKQDCGDMVSTKAHTRLTNLFKEIKEGYYFIKSLGKWKEKEVVTANICQT